MSASEGASSLVRRLVLRKDVNELPRLAAFARATAEHDGVGQDQVFALELCLEEAVANIILHGGTGDHAGTHIRVTITYDAPALIVLLEDDGSAFDPTQVPPPPTPASLAEAPIGGLGVHLMRKLTSEMRYERIDGKNCLTLVFRRPGQVAADAEE